MPGAAYFQTGSWPCFFWARLRLVLSVHSEQIAANTRIGVTTDKAKLFSMLRYPPSGYDQPAAAATIKLIQHQRIELLRRLI
jgi:hypothetical protein